jgi:Flp pilus assembly protein TadG
MAAFSRTDADRRNGAFRRILLSRFLRDRGGATAIEFMMLSLPFSVLVFAILESCISFAGQQILANATDSVARQLRTGQLKESEMTETKLKELICDQLEVIVASGCPGLEVDLRNVATFEEAAAFRIKLTGSGDEKDIDTSGFIVDPGESQTKNMLRVFYRWPVVTDFMRLSLSNLKDGKTLLFATATWQNEPFDD